MLTVSLVFSLQPSKRCAGSMLALRSPKHQTDRESSPAQKNKKEREQSAADSLPFSFRLLFPVRSLQNATLQAIQHL